MKADNSFAREDVETQYFCAGNFPAEDSHDKVVIQSLSEDHPFAIRLQISPSDLFVKSADQREVHMHESYSRLSEFKADDSLIPVEVNTQLIPECAPITEDNICSSDQSLDSHCEDTSLKINKAVVRHTLVSIEKYENILLTKCANLINACEQFTEEQTRRLSHLKKETQNAIIKGLSETRTKIMDWGSTDLSNLGLLLTSASAADQWLFALFKFEERETDVGPSETVGLQWRCGVDAKGNLQEGMVEENGGATQGSVCNPLFFPEVNSYLAACLQKHENTKSVDACRIRLNYYKSHSECMNAKEEAYTETLQKVTLDEGVDAWIRLGSAIFHSKVKERVPESYSEDLTKRLSMVFKAQKEAADAAKRSAELKAQLSLLEKASAVPLRRKRGRPSKLLFIAGNEDESLRKLQKGQCQIVGEDSMGEKEDDGSSEEVSSLEEPEERTEWF